MKPFNDFLNETESATPATADQQIVEEAAIPIEHPTESAVSAVPRSKDASTFAEEMEATLVRTIKELWNQG